MSSEATGPAGARHESWRNKLVRWRINFFYLIASSGTWATFVSDDWREAELTVRLTWRNRNYRGTIFGGTLYSAVDPVYMLMLARNLGPDYSVWDTRATIHFQKAGRGKLYAHFKLGAEELETIRQLTAGGQPVERHYAITLADEEGTPHVVVEKTIYIRKKDPSKANGKDRVSGMLKMR
jgi:acyl-coenzyme A thioesterase PaaI-like protein